MSVFDKILFGQSVKNLRTSKDLNQIDFAKSVDVGNGSLSEIEQGKRVAGIDFLYSVCREYDVSADEMIGLGGRDIILNDSRTYEDGYNDCLKDNETEVIKLKGQIEILLTALILKTGDESKEEQQQQVKKIMAMPQKNKYTNTDEIENEAEPSPVRVRPRTPKHVTPMKVAATPLVGGTNTNDQP